MIFFLLQLEEYLLLIFVSLCIFGSIILMDMQHGDQKILYLRYNGHSRINFCNRKVFAIQFFDIQINNIIHLLKDVDLIGPIYYM